MKGLSTKLLDGLRVALTGKLASLNRHEAFALVEAHGGTPVTVVSGQTSMLVIGQEGWPLQKDGTLSRKLVRAKRLQTKGGAIEILTEAEFLGRLGMEGEIDGIHKRFSQSELGRVLKVPRDRLRVWIKAGILAPIDTIQGIPYFDFAQVSGIRTLWELTQAGVSSAQIRRSLERLSTWMPSMESSLSQLQLLEGNGTLLVRTEQGLADASGQLHLEFDDAPPVLPSLPATSVSAEEWRERGYALHDEGRYEASAHAYRQALFLGVSNPVGIIYNLGSVLYATGQLGAAAERFRQALELQHDYAPAWNNLGNALMESGQTDDAIRAYQRAVEVSPDFPDVHYNLADALHAVHRFSEARVHWKQYLRLEPAGEWADYARWRLRRPCG